MGIDGFQTRSVKDVRLYRSYRVLLGIVFRRKTASRTLRDRGPSLVLQPLEEMASPGPFLQVGAFPACGKDQLGSSSLRFKKEILESAMVYVGCGSVSCVRPRIKVCTGLFCTEFQRGVTRCAMPPNQSWVKVVLPGFRLQRRSWFSHPERCSQRERSWLPTL